jgi:transcriptional regulator of acetoin/glycerol metabolism
MESPSAIVGDDSKDQEFKHWGIWLGGVWSEQFEGTNGIGTCITDRRPVLVHCAEHFRSRHTRLSCAGAPIFDPQGGLLGVLDVSKVHQISPAAPDGGRLRADRCPDHRELQPDSVYRDLPWNRRSGH